MDVEAHMRDMRERSAEAFGRPPEGQEHRAWVDHGRLRAIDPGEDSHQWEKALGYLGLSRLDPNDPAVPADLRDLLHCRDGDWSFALFFGAVWSAVFAVASAVAFGGYGAAWENLFPVAFFSAVVAVVLGGLLGDPLTERWPALTGRPAPWTSESRKRAALDRLEAAPFVVLVGGLLVENVPTLSRLIAWERELRSAADASRRRLRELDAIRERIDELRDRLGEGRAPVGALREAIARERVLDGRTSELLARVEARRATLSRSLAELRDRAELLALHDRAERLAGRAPGDAASRVGAELELEVDDLAEAMASLRTELADEVSRVRALHEVTALGS